jgi:hypothetical protein
VGGFKEKTGCVCLAMDPCECVDGPFQGEVFHDPPAGLIVPSRDPDALADVVHLIAKSKRVFHGGYTCELVGDRTARHFLVATQKTC